MTVNNLLVMANKRYPTDFRKYLIRAAAEAGGRAVHVYCWEEVVITAEEQQVACLPPFISPSIVFDQIRKHLGPDPCVVLTGLGGNVTELAFAARRFLDNSIFVYDIYDDFRFGATDWELRRRVWQDWRWRCYADWGVVLEGGLQWAYPGALHLDNASHLGSLPRPEALETDRVVYIGSIDQRVDFTWLDALASHGVHLDIWGRVHPWAREAEKQIASLTTHHPRVAFRGEYDNDDLPAILSQYRIGILPYVACDPITRHVNPDKLYHYLNSGLEVVASSIPQARRMADYIHIADKPDWPRLVKAIAEAPRTPAWPAEQHSWQHRWAELRNEAIKRLRKRSSTTPDETGHDPVGSSRSSPPFFVAYPQLGCGSVVLCSGALADILLLPGAEFLDFSKSLPFPDASFEAILCENTIENLPKETTALLCREAFRILRPAGVFRVVTPSLENIATLVLSPESPTAQRYLAWYCKSSGNHSATLSDAVNDLFYRHDRKHVFSRQELRTMLLEAGFVEPRACSAVEYGQAIFAGAAPRGALVGEEIRAIDSMALEASKPAIADDSR